MVITYNMNHKFTLLTYYVMVKEPLNKKMMKNSACLFPQKIVLLLPVSIFLQEILYLYFKIVGVCKICWKTFLT